jgi:hypothetical protein
MMATPTRPSAPFIELAAGDEVAGRVVRLAQPGVAAGSRLFLKTAAGLVAVPATAKKGHCVLERLLADHRVCVGDHVTVGYRGKRSTVDGLREYRDYWLVVHRGG